MLLAGVFAVAVGLVLVIGHNVWSGSGYRSSFIKGIALKPYPRLSEPDEPEDRTPCDGSIA